MSLKKYFKLYTLLLLFSFCKAQNKDNFPEIKLIGPPAIDSVLDKSLTLKLNVLQNENTLKIDSILAILTPINLQNFKSINTVLSKISKIYDKKVIHFFLDNIDFNQKDNNSLRSWDYVNYPFIQALIHDSISIAIYNSYMLQSDILSKCDISEEKLKLYSILLKFQTIEYDKKNIVLKYKYDEQHKCKYKNLEKLFQY